MEYDIRAYGESKRGRSHEVSGKPCQDSSFFGLHPAHPHIAILIVADGVGSAERSDEGSRIAVDTVRSYLSLTEPPFTPDIIRTAYEQAWDAIDSHTEAGTGWPCDYDTTLSVAVFDAESGRVVYGHSGDGAILAIGMDGIVRSLTEPQKGAEANSVKPLRDHFSWVFGEDDGPFASVMAMTDGVLDLLMPGRLKLTDEPIYVRLVSWLADFKFFEKKGTPIEECFSKRLKYIQSDIHAGITNDDLTFVAAMNIHVTSEYRGDEYYKEPDWAALNEEWKRKAYPSLYSDTPVNEPTEPVEDAQPAEARIHPDGQSAYNRALWMRDKRNLNHAVRQFRLAAGYGHPDAIAYLDMSTLGPLDDDSEMIRCRIGVLSRNIIACTRIMEYYISKGESHLVSKYSNLIDSIRRDTAGTDRSASPPPLRRRR